MHNEMLHHPAIPAPLREFLRAHGQPLPEPLNTLENQARAADVPIIPHETVDFFQTWFRQVHPTSVLELGTAIGFSALLFAQLMGPAGRVTTLERAPIMIGHAQANLAQYNTAQQITLRTGDATTLLPTLTDTYDVAFMDSAKAQYIHQLSLVLARVKVGGTVFIDDVLQGGTIFLPETEIPHRLKGIHRNLRQLLESVFAAKGLTATLIPLGDGLLMMTKDVDQDFTF
ncbi:O-methyltransferase [Schleiferilactobacillus harbinensis]|uniref:O-methyltransferase n=1 Tax=Schleiferilactobacillus harbinensis TaxID=304207 RepID=A0ABU7SXZ7_9LACO